MTVDQFTQSRYAVMLPEALQESIAPGEPSSAVRLLRIIEEVFGKFEAELNTISNYFHPLETDEEFLPWLASWVSLVLRTDWTKDQQRKVLAQIIPLYRKRGTKEGLEEYLKIYAGPGVTIKDEHDALQIGIFSEVGVNTNIGGLPPYFFIVNVTFGERDKDKLREKLKAVGEILEVEKPAYTFYEVDLKIPTLEIGKNSTIGKDTLI